MKTPLLNLRYVECFVAAADAGTMTAAAARLRVSQSAVSLAVAALERALQTQLLIRRRSLGLALTEAGRAFLPEARDLLAHADDAASRAQGGGTQLTGRLVVGCFRTAAPFLLPQLLESFGREHPSVELGFVEGTLHEIEGALRAGRCELALVYDLDVADDIACEPLYQARPYVLVSAEHPLAARGGVTLAELDGLDMVMLDVPPSREYMSGVLQAGGARPRIRHVTSSYELLRSLVGRNLGCALVISRPVGDLSYEGRPLAALEIRGAANPIDVSIARLRGVRPTHRASVFAEHCRRTLPGSAGGAAAAGQSPPPATLM